MGAEIKPCSCKHAYQDKLYGKGQRVFNQCKGKDGATKSLYRCTVCGSTK